MIILKPEPIAAITAGAGNLLTPSPKEVFITAGAAQEIVELDLGAPRPVDTVFLGFSNGAGTAQFKFETTLGGGAPYALRGAASLSDSDALGPVHGLLQLPAFEDVRYCRLTLERGNGPAIRAAILILGKRFQAPHERGGGRQLIDTGTKEQLPDGGLGGEDGVIKAALKWRFSGLSDAMRRQLWAVAIDRGERKPVVIIEEADTEADGANERIHYGTFDRFEAYERRDPNETAWGLSMTEWL